MTELSRAATDDQPESVGRRCVCYNLRRASRAISRLYDRHLAPSGLRSTQFSILAASRRLGPVPLTRLADAVVAERTTLTRNLGILEREGYLRTEPGQDRRERRIAITDKGVAVLERAVPLWEEAQAAVEERLGGERAKRLLEDLAAMVEAIRP